MENNIEEHKSPLDKNVSISTKLSANYENSEQIRLLLTTAISKLDSDDTDKLYKYLKDNNILEYKNELNRNLLIMKCLDIMTDNQTISLYESFNKEKFSNEKFEKWLKDFANINVINLSKF